MKKLTITVDLDRVDQYAELLNTQGVADFLTVAAQSARTGGHIVWAAGHINIGTVGRSES